MKINKNLLEPKGYDIINKRLTVSDGAGAYLSGFVFIYLIQILFIFIVSGVSKNPDGFMLSSTASFLIAVLNQLAYLASVAIYGKICKQNLIWNSRARRLPSLKQTGILVGVAILCIIAFAPIAELFLTLVYALGYKGASGGLIVDSVGKYFLSLLTLAVIPAIVEEILFRGSVAKSFATKGYVFAMVLSGILFGLIHGNVEQFVHQAFLGVVLAFVYFATRSIWASIIVHFVNNAVVLTVSFLSIKGNISIMGNTSLAIKIPVMIVISIVGIFALLVTLRYYLKVCKARLAKEEGISVKEINGETSKDEIDERATTKNQYALEKASEVVLDKNELPENNCNINSSIANKKFGVLVKEFFQDFANAFYPKGIKNNCKRINESLVALYERQEENDLIHQNEIAEQLQIDEVTNKTVKADLIKQKELRAKKRKRADSISLLMCVSLVGAVWIYSLITGIIAGVKG